MEITKHHDIQKDLLRRLGYSGPKSFSELQGDVPSNKFSFHLDRMQEKGLVKKRNNMYDLTAKGIEALPYLSADTIERPIMKVDLFLHDGDRVYLEKKEEDALDVTAGKIQPPSTRTGKDRDLKESAAEIYRGRFDGEAPDLELVAVIESATRFQNGAVQVYVHFYFGAEVGGNTDWYTPGEMVGETFLPGMKLATEKILESDGFIHGIWDLKRKKDGLELDRFEVM